MVTNSTSFVICCKCGRVEEFCRAVEQGWLIAQRQDKPVGYLIIRCSDHVTDYACRQAGFRQGYYRHHKHEV